MKKRFCAVAGLMLGLTSCAAVPMTVITQNGRVFRGALSASYPMTFSISDGRVNCSGKFPPIVPGHTHSYALPMACNHGVTGIAIFADIENLQAGGGGTLRLSDGTAGTFITGEGAAAL